MYNLMIQRFINLFEVAAIIFVMLLALLFQFHLHELPCPLCLLQRAGFIGITFGFLLNFKFGFRPSHYAIAILSALFTSFVALRQIALHVIPGTGAYGNAFLGLHLYTWSFIIAMCITVVSTLLLSYDQQFKILPKPDGMWLYIRYVLFSLVVFIIAINLLSVIIECGFMPCPDNPVKYEMISSQRGVL